MSLRFKFLTGDVDYREYGGKWISKKLNNGDFDYYMVIESINLNEVDIDPDKTYWVILSAVSINEAQEHLESAYQCHGYEPRGDETDEAKVEMLHGYGVYSLLWDQQGNNYKKLMKEAHKEAFMAQTLFGFYMDRPQNRIGATGWDIIKGDLFPEGWDIKK